MLLSPRPDEDLILSCLCRFYHVSNRTLIIKRFFGVIIVLPRQNRPASGYRIFQINIAPDFTYIDFQIRQGLRQEPMQAPGTLSVFFIFLSVIKPEQIVWTNPFDMVV